MNLGVEGMSQFVGEPTARSLTDEGLNGGDERTVTREPDGIVGPEAGTIEASDFAKRIIASAMGIAG